MNVEKVGIKGIWPKMNLIQELFASWSFKVLAFSRLIKAMFFEGEAKRFSVKMKGVKRGVNIFENVFHMSFLVQCGCDPQSKNRFTYWRVLLLI